MQEPQTRRLALAPVGYEATGTYLAEVAADPGGRRAAELGQRAAQRYLKGISSAEIRTPLTKRLEEFGANIVAIVREMVDYSRPQG